MHVRDQRAFTRLSQLRRLIDRCRALATEFNLEEALGQPGSGEMTLPGSLAIDQLLSPKRYRKLRMMIRKAFGLDIEPLKRFYPLLICHLIDERILAGSRRHALDEDLWRYAREQGKELLGLERLEEQQALLHQISLESQLRALLQIGRRVSRHRKQVVKMADLYAAGDAARIYRAARRGAGEHRRLMLYNRNAAMADRLDHLIRSKSIFAVVGAGHLWGGKGMLRLLKKKGYSLTAMHA